LRSNVTVIENEKVKIVFRACLCQKWIDLFQTTTKMITIHVIEYILPAEMLGFVIICNL